MKFFSTILHQRVPAHGRSAQVCGTRSQRNRYGVLASMMLVVLFANTVDLRAQTPSLANYTITRQTGITYNSISSTGNSIPAWRNSYQWIYDDNRSYPIPIGFDFWYDGIRYTTLSVSTNGFVDFSSSSADGSIGVDQTGRDYDSENFTVSSTAQYPTSRGSWNVLAPMYYDLTTQNETNPLGSSFKYLTTGVAPNRVFTVEFDSLSAWNQALRGTALNFQVKLYETSGKIEFVYGNMIPGSASYAYTCAINGPNLSGGLTAVNFQTQQSVNSATFGTTPQNSLTPPPASLSQLRFLPPTPLDPTSLTFPNFTTTAMTLNWTDNATNEVGYAIYQSSDGSNYAFITQLAAHAGTGAMNYTSTGLVPNTTYYWRIYAVTEGGVSNVLAGNQSTAGAPNDTSATSGVWYKGTTWKSGGVPTSITNVVIADGHTVTIDTNFTVNSLTIGTGVSGILRFGNDNTPRYGTVITGVTVNSGGTLDVSTSSNTNGHLLVVGGDLINNGTLNLATDADSKVRLEFNKNGSQVINGSGSLTKVYRMTLNMGTSSNNILDIFPPSFTADTANFVTINNGTLRFSTSATLTPFAGNAQIPANGGLWLNNASANITATDSLGVAGLLRVTSGSLTVGTTANGNLRSGGGTFVFEGGTTTVTGRFDARDITTITNFQMTAGMLTVNTNGSAYAYAAPFSMTVAGSTFTMSGGTIIIQRQGGNSLGYVNTGASSSYAMSGGTIQIGNGSTPGTDILGIQSNIPIYNLTVSGAAGATGLAGSDLTVLNNVTIGNGTFLNGSTRTITVHGNWVDNGTYTSGTSTVVFNGSSQSISRASGESFNNVTVNSTGSVSLSNNVIVGGALSLTQGTLAVGTNTLTLNGTVSSTSGNLTSASTGTVNYNQGSAGQSVLAANYGNLTFSNFNKVLASSGTIGIASVFTQGSAVGHTNTGSTINYNGAGAQTVSPFTYRNLVLSNGGVKTASGASTVQGDLTISSGVTLADGGFAISVNGNVSNANLHTSTGAGALTLTGGGAAHTLSGGGSFGNLTMNDANGATLSGSITVNGTLTFTSGIITAANDTVILSSSGTVARTSGHVNGWLRKYIPSGMPAPTFETGTSTTYLPVTLQFASVTTPGTLTLKNTAGDHPQLTSSTIDPANSVNRYWTLLNNQIAFTAADITFNWISPADQDNAGAFASYFVSTYANSSWTQDASSNQAASSIKASSIAWFGDFAVGAGAATNAYRTKASGDWSDFTTVWEIYNGSTWGAASKSPQLADGSITIQNGHSITITTNLSGGTNGIDQLVIQSGGRIDVNTGGTLEIRNATAPGLTASGILSVNGGTFTTNAGPTITFANGSRYIHNQNGGTIPTATFGATSTVEVTGVTTTVPTGLNQTFGNFVWNSSGQTTNINLAGDPATVSSDFVVASTGTAELLLNDNTAAAKTIGGRFDIRGGRVVAKTSGNTAYGISVADSLSLTGGRLTFLRGSGTGAVSITVSGHVLVATTASDTLDLSSSSSNTSGTINVAKNFIHTGGVISESGGGTAAGNMIFNGTAPQTFTSTGNFSNRVNFTLNSGTTVNMGTSVAAGTGTFTVSAGANLGIGSLQGISSAGATGNVQTTTRTFSVGANYIYNGIGAQITGTGLPATANKLIITNGAGVQLSSNVTVTDSLQLLSGLFDVQTNTLTLNNVIYRTSGSFTSGTTGTVNYNEASNGQVVIGAQYGNLTFSNFNKVFPSSPADVVKIAGTFTAGSATGHTLTGSSVEFNGASQTIPALSYNNLRASGSGTAVLAGTTSVAGALDISGVTLSDGSFNLTANGNVNNTGSHTGTGRIVLSGSASTRTLTGGGSYTNLEINDVNGANFSGNVVINGTLILTNGLLTSATDTVIVNTPSAGVSKSGNLSHVNAKMKELVPVNASPQTFTFQVGDATTYAPVNLTVLSASTAGSITVSTTGTDHPQIATSGINASKSVNRYWTVGRIGLVLSSYNATFNFTSGDIDSGADPNTFVSALYSGGSWLQQTVGTRSSTSTQVTGATSFGDFQIGQQGIFTSNGGNWSNPASWTPSGPPTANAQVVIASGTVVIDVNTANIGSLTIQNGATLNGGGAFTLSLGTTVATTISNSGTFNANTVTVKLNQASTWSGSGAYNLNAINLNSQTLTLGSGVNVGLSGAGDPFQNPGSLVPGSNSTITYNGSSAQTISSSAGINFNNLQVTNSAGLTLQKNLTSSNLTGNLTVTSSGVLNTGDGTNVYTITGAGGSTTLTVGANSTLNIGSSAAAAGTFPTGFNTTSLNATSTVVYSNSSSATQTISATPTYGNVLISGTGAKTLGGGSISVAGNWTNNSGGAVDATGSTVTLNGSSAQTINGSTSTTFNNLSVSNSSGGVAIATSINVDGNLTVNTPTVFTPAAGVTIGGTGTLSGNGMVQVTRTAATADFSSQYAISNKTLTNLTVDYAGTGEVLSNLTYGGLKVSGSITGAGNSATVNGAFTVTGTFTPTSGTMTMNNGSSIVNSGGTMTFADLSIANAATVTETGAATVAGTLNIGTGATFTPAGTVTAKGNISNAGSQTGAGSIVLSGGSGSHTLSGGGSYTNLQLNDALGASISSNTTVTALTLTTGVLAMGANTLTIAPGGTLTRGGGYVNGNLAKTIPTGASTPTFEVGDATNYTPVNLSFIGVTSAGTLTVHSLTPDHPNIGTSTINSALTANRYWTLTNTGIVLGSYDATFTFVAGDLDGGADPTQFIVGRYAASSWTYPTVGTKTATSTQATGLAAFGDFQLGQQAIYTSNGGNWSAAGSWTPPGPPPANAQVVIASGTVVIDVNTASIGSLTIQSGAILNGGGAFALNLGSIAATTVSNSGTFNANTVTVHLNQASTWSGSGAYNLNTLDFNSNTLTLGSGVNVGLSGSGDPLQNPGTLVPGSNSTITYNGTSAQVVSSSANMNFNNLQITNTSGVTLQKNLTAANLTGNLTVASGGILNTGDGTNVYTVTGAGGSTALTVGANSTLNIGSSATAAGTFPTGFNTTALNSTSTVVYSNSSSATQTIAAAPTYGNILISGTGAKTLGGGSINVAGNWTNNSGGAINAAGSTVTLNGSSAQTIGGSTSTTFNNLSVSNTSGGVAIATNILVDGNLTVNTPTVFTPAAGVTIGGTGTLSGNGTVQVTRTAATADFSSQYTISNKTLTNLTVDYAATGQVLSNLTYGGLKISGSITGAGNTATVGGTFTVTGTFTPTSGTMTMNNGSSIVNSGGTMTFADLAIANSATVTETGAATVAGALNIGTGATFTPAGTVTAKGNISNAGSQTGAGTVVLSGGSSSHTLSGGGSYTNLQLNDALGTSISSNTTVNGTLTLTTGVFGTGANTLTIASGGSVSLGSGWVNGNLAKTIPTGASSPTFEVGDATNYTPVSLSFTGVGTAGVLTVNSTTPDHANIGTSTIDPTLSANRHWTLTNTGIVLGSYDATFTFVPGDLDAGADPAQFIVGDYSGGTWTYPTVGTLTATTSQATGITSFGAFQLGQMGGTFTSVLTGNWNTPATWDRNAVPTTNSSVVIGSGTTVTINITTANLKTVTIQNTGSLVGGGAFTLSLGANGGTDFDNSGTFTANGVGVRLNKNSQWVGSGVFNLNTIDFNSKSLTLAFASSNTVHLAGSGDPLLNPGTLVPGTTSTLDYNGSAAQLMSSSAGIDFNTIQVSNAAGVTLQKDLNATNLTGNLTVTSGGLLNTSDGTNVYNITGAGGSTVLTIGAASKIKVGSNATTSGSFASGFGSYTLDPTSTVEYANSSSATQNVSAAATYGNILFTGTASKSLGAGSIALTGSWTNNSTGGSIVVGTSTVIFSGNTSSLNGSVASQTFNNLVVNKTAGQTLSIGGSITSFTANGTITLASGALDAGTASAMNVGGNWVNNGGSFTAGTGTVTFNGSGAQSIGGSSATTFANLTISGTIVTLTNDAAISGNLLVSTGTMDLATFAANRTASGGSMTINSGTTLKVGGSSGGVAGSNFPNNFTTMNLNGTVEFSGSGAQTIPAFNYTNLTSSSTGGRTLASSGTIGISGVFTPGTNAYTTSGSTVDFNGAGSQSIAALNYNNLTISGNRSGNTVTLPAGTIRVAAVFAPTATVVSYVNTGNTFEYNGSTPQTVTPFTYFNLTLSGAGAKTVAASQTANGDVNLAAGASLTVDPTVVWQIDGSLTLDGSSVNNGIINVGN